MARLLHTYIFSFIALSTYAQIGGSSAYQFLGLPVSARVTALGQSLITVYDDDINLAYANPSLLNPEMDGKIAFNHNFMLGQSADSYVAYGHYVDRWDLTTYGGIKYLNYGDFVGTDIFGNEQGTFTASEWALTLGASRRLYERMSIGANLSFIQANFESYNSTGVALDLAASYILQDEGILMTLVIDNLGTQLSSFADQKERIVPNVQFGLSKRVSKLPFRYSLILHNLNRWDLLYDDPDADNTSPFGQTPQNQTAFGSSVDLFFRHMIINGEFLIGKAENLRLRLGYNHQRRKELSLANINSFSGFSYGFGIKIHRFRFDFGHTTYHLAGGTNHISISTNMSEFGRKRKQPETE